MKNSVIRSFLTVIVSSLIACCISLAPVSAQTPVIEPELTSDYGYVIDITNNQVLMDKNGSQRMYPASMTKMMTAIIALEKLKDFDQSITFTYPMLEGLWQQGASVVGYAQGDTATVKDLLYGIALPSGADACHALAITIAGSIRDFVSLMNEKAAAIGMNDTHFANPTGLHNSDHYSTAKDMAALLAYCLKNKQFTEIFSTSSYKLGPMYYYSSGQTLYNTSKYVIESEGINAPGFVGGKTGYTEEAGHCLASWSILNGMTIISIVAHADTAYRDRSHLYDTAKVLQQLSQWKKTRIINEGQLLAQITVEHQFDTETVNVYSLLSLVYDLPQDGQLVTEVTMTDYVISDVEPQQVSGHVTVKYQDMILYEDDLSVSIPKEPNFFGRIIKRIRKFFGKLFPAKSADQPA